MQTGPKGVIQDYRRYKQLETEQRKEKEKEMKKLAEKFSVSCQSSVSWLVFIIYNSTKYFCFPENKKRKEKEEREKPQ